MRQDAKTDEIETFVNNAVYLAKMKGSLKEFEDYCGVSAGYFSRRTSDGITKQRAISFQTVLLVCEYLERPLEDLLNPKLRYDLEAKRMQQKMEEIESARLSLTGEVK